MLKRKYNLFIVVIVIILQIFLLTGCSNKDDEENLKSKADEEMKYIDSQIVSMLNSLNNISYKNYLIIQESNNSNKTQGSNNETNNSTSNAGQGNSSEGSSGKQGENSNGGSNGGQNDIDPNISKVIPNNIIDSNRETNWDNLKTDVEKMYNTWSTVMLDLYKLNVNNNDILEFTTILDNITVEIQNKNKIKVAQLLSKLYSYIPKYMSSYTNDKESQVIYDTKSNILNAYALLEEDRWEDMKNDFAQAEEKFMPLLNELEHSNKNVNTDKIYVALKEIQKTADTKDKTVFYIKYKNLLEEMNFS